MMTQLCCLAKYETSRVQVWSLQTYKYAPSWIISLVLRSSLECAYRKVYIDQLLATLIVIYILSSNKYDRK